MISKKTHSIAEELKNTEGFSEELLDRLSSGFPQAVGLDFIQQVASFIGEALNVKFAFVGELVGGELNEVQITALAVEGKPGEPFSYKLAKTPCEKVIGGGICHFSDGVAELYPEDKLLSEMNIHGYIGSPLYDSKGNPLGIMVVLDTKPLENVSLLETVFRIFRDRVASELEHLISQKKAEPEFGGLEESDLWLQSIFHALDEAVFVVSPDRTLVSINRAAEVMFGYDIKELRNYSTAILHVDEQHFAEFGKLIQQAFQKGETARFEFEAKRKNGEVFPTEHTVSQLIDRDGNNLGIISVVRDISRQKAVEKELYESREELYQIVDGSPIPLALTDTENTILHLNKVFLKTFGYTKEDLKRVDDWWPLAYPDDKYRKELKKTWDHRVRKAVDTGEPIEPMNAVVRCKDGSNRHIVFNFAMAGRLGLTVFHDITDRHGQEERALKILNSTNEGFLLIDAKTGVILNANSAYCRMSGYQSEELRGMSIFDVDVKSNEEIKGIVESAIANGSLNLETIHRRKDGSIWEVDAAITYYPVDKKFYAFVRDMTVRKQYERERERHISEMNSLNNTLTHELQERRKAELALHAAKEEAEMAVQQKNKFISLVAHDLSGPMATVKGFLQLVLNDQEHTITEKQRELLEHATNISVNLMKVTADLLKMGQLQGGHLIVAPSFLNARLLSDEIVAGFRFTLHTKNITLENNIPPNRRLYADTELFGELLRNLLSNGIKFCNIGGTVTLDMPDGNEDIVTIRDTGKGFDEKTIENLFRSDVKMTSTGTAGETGTGLGLQYCLDIVKAHNGTLTVANHPDGGGLVTVSIPSVRPHVLVVDDDAGMRVLLNHYLKPINARVSEAEDGIEAISKIDIDPPHLIICDLQMPRMGGVDLIKRIREDKKTKGIPILIVTGAAEVVVKNPLLNSQVNDILLKPVKSDEFIARVQRILS